ncbi:MAG: MBL fold metallo-hydrolase [Desulfobulbaceae bacterium]|nr:MBL fold metallo-hydrolase [Desulfobulbaceae bacterium]
MVDDILRQLTWLGHDAFRLTTGAATIYFDPFKLAPAAPPADIILVSHDHYDHCSPEDIARIQGKETVIVTEPAAAAKLSGTIKTLAPGDRCEVKGITIEAVASYNSNKKFHPRKNNWLGFVVTVAGVRIYHAGDTDHIPEMASISADIALLPVGGTYTMTAEEAAQAALTINPKVAVPMHYNTLVGTTDDAKRFAAALTGKIRVELLVKKP